MAESFSSYAFALIALAGMEMSLKTGRTTEAIVLGAIAIGFAVGGVAWSVVSLTKKGR